VSPLLRSVRRDPSTKITAEQAVTGVDLLRPRPVLAYRTSSHPALRIATSCRNDSKPAPCGNSGWTKSSGGGRVSALAVGTKHAA
jgi:hypothetical protein